MLFVAIYNKKKNKNINICRMFFKCDSIGYNQKITESSLDSNGI